MAPFCLCKRLRLGIRPRAEFASIVLMISENSYRQLFNLKHGMRRERLFHSRHVFLLVAACAWNALKWIVCYWFGSMHVASIRALVHVRCIGVWPVKHRSSGWSTSRFARFLICQMFGSAGGGVLFRIEAQLWKEVWENWSHIDGFELLLSYLEVP